MRTISEIDREFMAGIKMDLRSLPL